jgi:hypothetical protein
MSIESYPSPNGVLTSLIWRKTAAGSETSLSGYDNASQALSYTPGQEQVYLNGILLVRGSDYTATNGTSITGLTALAVDDFVQINCYNNFSVASVPAASITGEVTNTQITSLATSKLTGTITNAQLAGSIANDKLTNSSITINGSAVSLGGSVSLAGDIESVTAGTGISGGGSSGAVTITNSMATAIDAKGDLVVGTGADTFAKLGVGANGTVLTAASGEATGLSWAAAAAYLRGQVISTTNLSGSSTVTVSGLGDYDEVFFHIQNAGWATSDGSELIRFNTDDSNVYDTRGFYWSESASYSNTWYTPITSYESLNNFHFPLATGATKNYGSVGNTTAATGRIWNMKGSGNTFFEIKRIHMLTNYRWEIFDVSGIYKTNNSITSLSLILQAGSQNYSQGTITLWGAKA